MSASEQQIQAINIEDADINRVEAEVEVLEVVDSEPSLLESYKKPAENLYSLQTRTEASQISATLYITDDPEADLAGMKEDLESMADERKNLISGSTQRNDLVRAIALQSKMTELGKTIKFKEQLLDLSNPVLEEDKPKATALLL
ncbi:hypothetical protein [Halobacterium salinarum]|uniref:hypothetical protein n=1 Tax=Halobacterium salinarum TaxID=2242 RepID=UPI002553A0A1|nr:hypothetical protein [Halobacterium salinarum]MDL0145777.1 hypothetical protein [Halobacterium salinarum]